MFQIRSLLRRFVPRVVRNWLRSPSQSWAWMWDELSHLLGHHPVISLRSGWSVRAHPTARLVFGIPLRDPDQIAELNAFIMSCHSGMLLFDIGAHFGLFSLAALHYGGPSARAVAVEPSRGAVRVLRLHARLNGVSDRLEAIDAAAADQSGWRDMLPVGVLAAGYYLEPDAGRHARDLVRVRSVTIDGLVDELGLTPTHVKIDVEGAEAGVLRGAQRVLAGDRPPVVFLELHNAICRKAGRDPADCLSLLARLGYGFQASDGLPLSVAAATAPRIVRLVARRPKRQLHNR